MRIHCAHGGDIRVLVWGTLLVKVLKVQHSLLRQEKRIVVCPRNQQSFTNRLLLNHLRAAMQQSVIRQEQFQEGTSNEEVDLHNILYRYMGASVELYWIVKEAIQLCEVTSIRLLLHVGIKVTDEWQISLDYVRSSNIYVRGYLDLRAWSLNLRAQTEENHYVKALFPSRERCFSLRWIRGILAIRRRACVALRRDMSGSRALRCLSTLNRGQDSRQQSPQGNLIEGSA